MTKVSLLLVEQLIASDLLIMSFHSLLISLAQDRALLMIMRLLSGWMIVAVWFGRGNILSPDISVSTVLLVCALISDEYNLFLHMVGSCLLLVFQTTVNVYSLSG